VSHFKEAFSCNNASPAEALIFYYLMLTTLVFHCLLMTPVTLSLLVTLLWISNMVRWWILMFFLLSICNIVTHLLMA